MFNFSFTLKSGNEKTGSIPVTRTDKRSCPDSCILKNNGCYAGASMTAIHWKKLDSTGLSLDEIVAKIKSLPIGQLWRHNEAGDLPGYDDKIDAKQLKKIVDANKGKKGFTYTHYPLVQHNLKAIINAVKDGFTINASFDNLAQLLKVEHLNIPKVVIVPPNSPNKFTYGNSKVVVCPAQIKDSLNCKKCGLCQQSDRKFVIGFKAHGGQKKKVIAIAKID